MSDTPEAITHGFCLNDSVLAWAMLQNTTNPKIIECRQFVMPAGWYAVSLTQNSYTRIDHELEYRDTDPTFPSPVSFPRGQVLGVVRIGYSLPQAMCAKNRWSVADYAVANVITHVIPFSLYDGGPHVRNNVGTFPLSKEAQAALKTHVEKYKAEMRATHAEGVLPACPGAVEASRLEAKEVRGKAPAKKAPKATAGAPCAIVKKAKPQASTLAKRSKTGTMTDAELDFQHSMKDMAWCERNLPETHSHQVEKKGILAFFEKKAATPNK
jgi:hypothetical protein